MGRASDRRRRPSYSSSRDGSRRVVQRDQEWTSASRGGTVWPPADAQRPMMPSPPPASAFVSRPSTVPYRRPSRTLLYDDGAGRHGHSSEQDSGRELSPLDRQRRHRHASPGSSTSSDGSESEDELDVGGEADDEASPTRARREAWHHHVESYDEGRVSEPGRRVSPCRRVYSDEHTPVHGASHSGRLIEAPPPPQPERPTLHESNDVLESRPPRSSKRHTKRSEPVILRSGSPQKPKKLAPRSGSVRSSPHRGSSVLSGILSGSTSYKYTPEKKKKKGKEKDKPRKVVECVICMGDTPPTKAPKLKCGHRMCRSCLRRIFELSVMDPQMMPPKCCTQDHISLRHVDPLFDTTFKKLWNRKYSEFTTQNRLYCPSKRCGEWIKPSLVRRDGNRQSARCGHCRTKVCVVCNGKWHSSFDCPKDEETLKFLKQAKEEGWQRCYSCRAMVERRQGCNHMTCRCGAQFCMLCGAKWKSCDCEWFNFDPDDNLDAYYVERGGIGDIFDGHGPPLPRQLRGHHGMPRPGTCSVETEQRNEQEQRDEELARRLQYDISLEGRFADDVEDDHDMMGGIGDVTGLGLSGGHHMNEHYNRYGSGGSRNRTSVPLTGGAYGRRAGHRTPPGASYDRGSYVTHVSRARRARGRSMERRLADRLSEHRGMARPDIPMDIPVGGLSPHMNRPGVAPITAPPPPPPMDRYTPMRVLMGMPPPTNDPPMTAQPHPFSSLPHQSPPMDSRPEFSPMLGGGRRRASDGAPRSSSLAGLNAHGGGRNRVSEWRNFVEPGVPGSDSARTSEERLSRDALI